jgi:hypothetical protein
MKLINKEGGRLQHLRLAYSPIYFTTVGKRDSVSSAHKNGVLEKNISQKATRVKLDYEWKPWYNCQHGIVSISQTNQQFSPTKWRRRGGQPITCRSDVTLAP